MNDRSEIPGETFVKPDKELLGVLREWDDKDAEALNASKARLAALGPDAFDRVHALLERVLTHYRVANGIAIGGFALTFLLMLAEAQTRQPKEPAPAWVLVSLMVIFCAVFGSAAFCLTRTPYKVARNAASALCCFPSARGLSLLLRLRATGSGYNTQHPQGHEALRTLLEQVSSQDTGCLNASDLRRLRVLASSAYDELACAAIRALTFLDDGSALRRVRGRNKYSKEFEIQEAVRDYMARFAPDEAAAIDKFRAIWAWRRQTILPASEEVNPILACVMQLGSRDVTERRAAETAIRQMGPEQIGQVLLLVGHEPATERRSGRTVIGISMLLTCLLNALWYPVALRLPTFDAGDARALTMLMMTAGLPIGWIIGLEINRRRHNQWRARELGCRVGVFPERRLLDALQTLDNPALVGLLTDTLRGAAAEMPAAINWSAVRAMRAALTHLLPRLQATDAHLLNVAQRARLNHELGRGKLSLHPAWCGPQQAEMQAAFDVAILKAWEQVGDENALPVVQKLAAQRAGTPAQKRVQQAAKSCLPYLETRAGEQRATQTLLRAADLPTTNGDVLLRAAAPQTTRNEAAQLLRANAKNQE